MLVKDFFIDGEDNKINQKIIEVLSDIYISNAKIEELRGGTSNKLYKIEGIKKNKNKKLLVRIYGNNELIDRKEEIYYLDKIYNKYKNLVPKIYLKFNNGLIYQYLEGDCLAYSDLPTFNENIAIKLSEWHKINIVPYNQSYIFR